MLNSLTWIFALLFLILKENVTSGEIYFTKGAPHVKLSNNALLSGKIDYSREGRPFHSFTGIPFGRIPARFQESEQVPAWDGTFDATKQGHTCVQTVMMGPANGIGEEDCLNLNVFVPMNNTQHKGGLPVMVWVHGGGLSMGSASEYGPKYFLDEDVILVTINYRLGIFGFLATGDSVVPGNNALKDQVLALKWVQHNIQNFGGDKGKVTIFGESAGGGLVHYLLLSPATEGLFQRAISQSGTALGPWAYNPNPRATAVKLATHVGCPTSAGDPTDISSLEIVSCLRGLSVQKLSEAVKEFIPTWPPGGIGGFSLEFGPVKESKDSTSPFLTESPWKLVMDNSIPHKEIPWMVGATEDEGVIFADSFINDPSLLTELEAKWDEIILKLLQLEWSVRQEETKVVARKIRNFYFGDKPVSKATLLILFDILSDAWFVHGARRAAIQTALKGNKVYLYQYAHQGPVSMLKLFGDADYSGDEELLKKVEHFADCAVQFNLDNMMPGAGDLIRFDHDQKEFSRNFVKLWVSFAKYGKPNYTWPASKDEWKPIPKKELDGTSPLHWYKITSNPGYINEGRWKERALFWDQLYQDHFLHVVLSLSSSSSDGKKTEL